jgi:hypothetical protein
MTAAIAAIENKFFMMPSMGWGIFGTCHMIAIFLCTLSVL